MRIIVQSEKIAQVYVETLVVGFFEDVRPLKGFAGEIDWYTNGAVSDLVLQNKIRGTLGEASLLATSKLATPKVLLIGLGPKKYYSVEIFQRLSGHALEILSRLKPREAAMDLWGQDECELDLFRCLEGFLQGYQEVYPQPSEGEEASQLTLLTRHPSQIHGMRRRVDTFQQKRTLSLKKAPKDPKVPKVPKQVNP